MTRGGRHDGLRRALGLGAMLAAGAAVPAVAAPDCGLYDYRARITRVIDGDTVVADVDLGFGTWRHGERLRLAGIDAPEPRGESRAAGEVASAALAELVEDREVTICTLRDESDGFGRYLAVIWLDGATGLSVNDWLLERGFATPYPSGS